MKITESYCINLLKRSDRRERMIILFDKYNVNYQWFQAIEPEKGLGKLSRGELGCALSHIELAHIGKRYNKPFMHVLEDDIDFSNNYQNDLQAVVDMLPEDWEMLYLGCNPQTSLTTVKIENNISLAKCHKMFTTHNYIMNSKIFDEVIAFGKQLTEPIDVFYTNIHKRGNSYTCIPSISWQVSDYSDIEECQVTNRERVTKVNG